MNALYIVAGIGIVSLLAEIANLTKWVRYIIGVGLMVALGTLCSEWGTQKTYFQEMLLLDNSALAFICLLLAASFIWLLTSNAFLKEAGSETDRSVLIVYTLLGGMLMASFNNMTMLFLGIEILSIALYVLAGSRKDLGSTEAAFKYLLMGSFATGFLLFGLALVYGATGLFQIDEIGAYIQANSAQLPGFFYVGVLLILAGLCFKISAVPFHFWAPDVYTGAPTPVTGFMSTVVKIAAVAAFTRLFNMCFVSVSESWILPLQVITVLTLIIPNVIAVYQTNVKRLLAYSSVGHVGYLLLGYSATPVDSQGPIFYYLAAYAAASLGAFTILQIIENNQEEVSIDHFNGLFKRNAGMAVLMTISLLSLAGIPPLAGFFGKYLVFTLALENGQLPMVIVAIISSLIGVYYYFKVIIAMFIQENAQPAFVLTTAQRISIFIMVLLIAILSLFPNCLIELI
jgi:NADH-quinone oxidoreductase subunit N